MPGFFGRRLWEWFTEHEASFLYMDWPPKSPDLNFYWESSGCAEVDFRGLVKKNPQLCMEINIKKA